MQDFIKNIEKSVILAKKGIISYTDFLSEAEQALSVSVLKKQNVGYSFFGGYKSAERKILAVYEDNYNELVFPIITLRINIPKSDEIRHGDYLGSLMNLGINRNIVGDIVIDDNGAYIILMERMKDYICQNLIKIKNRYVDIFECENAELPEEKKFDDVEILISSNRLDCYVSAICNLSREKSASLINSKKVFINHVICEDISKKLLQNSILTIRGFGKYIIHDDPDNCYKTKKNRLKLLLKKYGG